MAPQGGAVLVVVAVPVVLVRRFSDLLCAPPPTNRWNRTDSVGGFFFSSIVSVFVWHQALLHACERRQWLSRCCTVNRWRTISRQETLPAVSKHKLKLDWTGNMWARVDPCLLSWHRQWCCPLRENRNMKPWQLAFFKTGSLPDFRDPWKRSIGKLD